MKRLDKEEYVPYAPEEEGVVRINHSSSTCHGDSKSMRVERKDDGYIVAKCYRCGGFGRYREAGHRYHTAEKAIKSRNTSGAVRSKLVKEVTIPRGSTGVVTEWGIEARTRFAGYGYDQAVASRYGIVWNDFYKRLIIPVYRNGDLLAWQGRSYEDDQPKYITRAKDTGDLWIYIPHEHGTSDRCTVVEDMFSAIKVSYHTNALALLGNNISYEALDYATSKCDKFLIYLDNDGSNVIMNAHTIDQTLTFMGKESMIIGIPVDPKELDDATLRRYLT